MSEIGYGYGSEWHLLRWLGYHRAELSAETGSAIAKTLPDIDQNPGNIEWLDLDWNSDVRPLYRDKEWEGIKFVTRFLSPSDAQAVMQAWKDFWPSSGTAQCWDAVGMRRSEDSLEWLLVEAKAHALELGSNGSEAGPESLKKIKAAFVLTQKSLGIYSATDAAVNDKIMLDWLGRYYQYANRLAALYFFNEYLPKTPQHHSACKANQHLLSQRNSRWMADAPDRAGLGRRH